MPEWFRIYLVIHSICACYAARVCATRRAEIERRGVANHALLNALGAVPGFLWWTLVVLMVMLGPVVVANDFLAWLRRQGARDG